MTAERRYQLKPLGDGLYLLPGNDIDERHSPLNGTMFLIQRWEDGPELGAERRRTRWTLSAASAQDVRDAVVVSGSSNPATFVRSVAWSHVAECDTRRTAIAEAVALSEARRTS